MDKEVTDFCEYVLTEDFTYTLDRQDTEYRSVGKSSTETNRGGNRTEKMEMDWAYAEETAGEHHPTCPTMEPTGTEKKRQATSDMEKAD